MTPAERVRAELDRLARTPRLCKAFCPSIRAAGGQGPFCPQCDQAERLLHIYGGKTETTLFVLPLTSTEKRSAKKKGKK